MQLGYENKCPRYHAPAPLTIPQFFPFMDLEHFSILPSDNRGHFGPWNPAYHVPVLEPVNVAEPQPQDHVLSREGANGRF